MTTLIKNLSRLCSILLIYHLKQTESLSLNTAQDLVILNYKVVVLLGLLVIEDYVNAKKCSPCITYCLNVFIRHIFDHPTSHPSLICRPFLDQDTKIVAKALLMVEKLLNLRFDVFDRSTNTQSWSDFRPYVS